MERKREEGSPNPTYEDGKCSLRVWQQQLYSSPCSLVLVWGGGRDDDNRFRLYCSSKTHFTPLKSHTAEIYYLDPYFSLCLSALWLELPLGCPRWWAAAACRRVTPAGPPVPPSQVFFHLSCIQNVSCD